MRQGMDAPLPSLAVILIVAAALPAIGALPFTEETIIPEADSSLELLVQEDTQEGMVSILSASLQDDDFSSSIASAISSAIETHNTPKAKPATPGKVAVSEATVEDVEQQLADTIIKAEGGKVNADTKIDPDVEEGNRVLESSTQEDPPQTDIVLDVDLGGIMAAVKKAVSSDAVAKSPKEMQQVGVGKETMSKATVKKAASKMEAVPVKTKAAPAPKKLQVKAPPTVTKAVAKTEAVPVKTKAAPTPKKLQVKAPPTVKKAVAADLVEKEPARLQDPSASKAAAMTMGAGIEKAATTVIKANPDMDAKADTTMTAKADPTTNAAKADTTMDAKGGNTMAAKPDASVMPAKADPTTMVAKADTTMMDAKADPTTMDAKAGNTMAAKPDASVMPTKADPTTMVAKADTTMMAAKADTTMDAKAGTTMAASAAKADTTMAA